MNGGNERYKLREVGEVVFVEEFTQITPIRDLGMEMPGKISIRNLRNIKKLNFSIPDPGVWLLTASNGGGKTSLLACLRRIGQPNSFQTHFPNSLQSSRLDNHLKGSIVYSVGGEQVEYAYRGSRWTPRPRSNSGLLDDFGFPFVAYVGASAERVTPRSEDFDPRKVSDAHQEIIDAANEIFETSKFDNLKKVNVGRGRGQSSAFVMLLGGSPRHYHSERHFSLGELCILKLLSVLREAKVNGLVLIDELEMAIHPRAQVKLLEYLTRQAKEKKLTVIFSTHSVTLLKTIDRKKIIFLENNGEGSIKSIVGCFPTYAIGHIASDEEGIPDSVIYVEDDDAKAIASALYKKYLLENFPSVALRPTLKFAPIGGFKETVKYLGQSRSMLPEHCAQHALLDGDVADETLKAWSNANNHDQLALFKKYKRNIHYLPWAPEVGLLDHIVSNLSEFEKKLREVLDDNGIHIRNQVSIFDQSKIGPELRRSAKRANHDLREYLCERTGKSREVIRATVAEVFADRTWQDLRADLSPVFGRALS